MYLRRRDLTLEKITSVIQLPNLKDFTNCYECLKVSYMKYVMKETYANVDNIIYETLKLMDNKHKVTVIFETANEIAKKLLTEYIFLSFMTHSEQNQAHYQFKDYIACIIALIMSFDIYGTPKSITYLIEEVSKFNSNITQFIKATDIVKYYNELH